MTIAPLGGAVLLLALLAAGCAGFSEQGAGGGGGGEVGGAAPPAGPATIARGDLLTGLERQNPDLALSEAASEAAGRAGREALLASTGGRTTWDDPATGTHGSFIVLRDYTSAAGSYCREILAGVVAPSGTTYTSPILACRRADGRWYILD